jgi:hypothetical protein
MLDGAHGSGAPGSGRSTMGRPAQSRLADVTGSGQPSSMGMRMPRSRATSMARS